jgi:hypothetical protein
MKKEKARFRGICLFVAVSMVSALLLAAVAGAQDYPIMNRVADKVIQKYQNSTCEQLWQERGQPKPPMEQEAVQLLQGDPQMRAAFINKVAGPIANKMFECGMIP